MWARADLVCKVKEPQADELARSAARPHAVHLPPPRRLPRGGRAPCARRAPPASPTRPCARADGQLPLLAPMSEVAGRMAVQVGARFLEAPQGGRGVLLGGAPGVQPGRVAVIGAGNVGWNAAWIAAGMEAEVNLLDRDLDRLRFVDQIHQGPHHHAGLEPRHGRALRGRGRPRHRRRARRRRSGARGGHRGHGPLDAPGLGDRRRGHRPGRLRGHLARDDAPRADATRSTASCTTAWATSPARCRPRPRTRSRTPRSPTWWRWPSTGVDEALRRRPGAGRGPQRAGRRGRAPRRRARRCADGGGARAPPRRAVLLAATRPTGRTRSPSRSRLRCRASHERQAGRGWPGRP